MTPTLRRKLEALAERREELERLLAEPDVVADNTRFRDLSREFAQLEPIAIALADEARAKADLAAAERLDQRQGQQGGQQSAAGARHHAYSRDHAPFLAVLCQGCGQGQIGHADNGVKGSE